MKLTTTEYGYVCDSDPRLRFHRCRGGWQFRLEGHHYHTFGNLAEAEVYVRPHWRPAFIGPILDRLHGDGLALWDAAVLGDEEAFSLLLDWVEDNVPEGHGVYTDREDMLPQADECGLFRVRPKGASSKKRPPPVTARVEGGELVVSGLRRRSRGMAARFAARSPRWYMPAEDALRCELAPAERPREARLPVAIDVIDFCYDGLMLSVDTGTWLGELFRRGDAAGVHLTRPDLVSLLVE